MNKRFDQRPRRAIERHDNEFVRSSLTGQVGTSIWFVLISLLLSAFGWQACSPGNCEALCLREATFALQTPLSGQTFGISLTITSSGVGQILECAPKDAGAISCNPFPSELKAQFDDRGRLQSIVWNNPDVGSIRLQISVDNVQAVDATFDYRLVPDGQVCGNACYQSPTFTIQN